MSTALSPRTSPPYQDEWVRGRRVRAGYRECAERYEVVREAFRGLRRPFSVLDLGAHSGYFSFRLAEDFGASCTLVDDYVHLTRLVEDNGNERLTLIHRKLGVRQILALGSFDVVLALSVLHHHRQWRWLLASLRGMARSKLIIETPHPSERLVRASAGRYIGQIDQAVQAVGVQIGGSSGVWDRSKTRAIYQIEGKPRMFMGTVFAGSGNHSEMAPRFAEKLASEIGYLPFPGSLNLRTTAKDVRKVLGPPALDFQDETRPGRGKKGGDYQLWPARIGDLECHAIIPGIRNHGPDSLEVIAPVKLRDALGLEDGSEVTIEVGAT